MNRDIEDYFNRLQDFDFFKRFTVEQIQEIISGSIIHQYPKGQVLSYHGDPMVYYYFLFRGLVSLEKIDLSGEYSYKDYIKKNTFFPYRMFLNEEERYSYTAISEDEIDVLLLPKDLFESMVVDNKHQMLYMYQKMSEILKFQELRLQLTVTSSAYERVQLALAIWIYDLGKEVIVNEQKNIVIPYSLTINELGESAGTTRETASRVIKDLDNEGKIKFTRKEILIYNSDFFTNFLL